MKLIKSTTWEKVFQDWQKQEGSNPDWIKCATEIKGWPDWKSWRSFTAGQLRAPAREWKIYQFTDPLVEIPEMLVGPFNSWQKNFTKKNTANFAQLLAVPGFSPNQKVSELMAALPFSTQFIGLKRQDRDKIVCLEGHHRAVAFALSQQQKKQIDFRPVRITIALADVPDTEENSFDQVLARGTSKHP